MQPLRLPFAAESAAAATIATQGGWRASGPVHATRASPGTADAGFAGTPPFHVNDHRLVHQTLYCPARTNRSGHSVVAGPCRACNRPMPKPPVIRTLTD